MPEPNMEKGVCFYWDLGLWDIEESRKLLNHICHAGGVSYTSYPKYQKQFSNDHIFGPDLMNKPDFIAAQRPG